MTFVRRDSFTLEFPYQRETGLSRGTGCDASWAIVCPDMKKERKTPVKKFSRAKGKHKPQPNVTGQTIPRELPPVSRLHYGSIPFESVG